VPLLPIHEGVLDYRVRGLLIARPEGPHSQAGWQSRARGRGGGQVDRELPLGGRGLVSVAVQQRAGWGVRVVDGLADVGAARRARP